MYKFFEWQIIKSFLKRKQGDMAYSIISLLSLLGISLAVAVIITVMSVMNGFQIEIQEKMLNLIPHATIKNINSVNNKSNVDLLNSILEKKEYVESHSVFVDGEAIAITNSNFNAIQIKAYAKEAAPIKNKLSQLMVKGEVNDLYNKSFNVIIGKGLSEQLKIKLGDK